jgi:uncharacterized protein involved in outer membrane biogenesis
MRKIAIIIGIVLVLLVVAVAALPFVLDVNKYRGRIQSELQQQTGRTVSLGKMDLKVFPLAFRVENAVIGEEAALRSARPFVQVEELLVSAQLLPLLRGDVQVDSLELRKPKIEMIKKADGTWNFASLGKTQAAPSAPSAQPGKPQPPQSQPPPQPSGKEFTLDQLRVVDGQVAITDLQKRQSRSVYDHIDLEVEDYAPNKAVTFDLAAHLPGTGKQTIRLSGQGGPVRKDNPAATDFNGDLTLEEVSLSGIQKFVNSAALQGIEFVASGKAEIANKGGIASSKGDLTLTNPVVRGVNVGYPITADYSVRADLNTDAYTIEKGDLKLGSTPISINGLFNAGATPSQMDLKVKTSGASISEAARLASAFGVAFNPGTEIRGRLDADITARGTTASPALNGAISARELVITGKMLPQAVQVTNVNLALSPNSIKSNEFVATTGSTSVNVAFTLNNYSGKTSSVDATVRAPNAQLGELINIAQAYGVSAVEGMNGSGAVSIDVRVQGAPKVPASMNYSGSGRLQNASLIVPAFTKPLQVKNADLRFTRDSAVLDNAAFSMGSTNANGQLTLKGLAPGADPVAQFNLSADKFVVTEWQQMMAHAPVPAQRTSLAVIPYAHAQSKPAEPPLITRLTGNGNAQIGTLVYDEIQMTNVKSPVVLDHGVIRLSPLTAQVFGGTQTGTIVVDTRPTPATYTISTKLQNVDANKLLSSMSNMKQTLFGILAANADTRFTAGASSNVASTLDGKLSLNLQNGRLVGIDMLNQLAKIGNFLQGQKAQEPFTNIAKLTGDFDIDNGVAKTNNLQASIDGGSVAATGALNLANQTVDMAVTAVLSKDYSQKVGGTNVGGYLTTALSNRNGELVMPVLISGPLTAPKVQPDYKKIAQMKLENVVPGLSSGGGVGGLLEGILGKKPTGEQTPAEQPQPGADEQSGQTTQQQPQRQRPASPLQGILEAIGGKQKTKQPPPQPQEQPKTDDEKLPDPSNPK